PTRAARLARRRDLAPQTLRDRLRQGPDLLLEQPGHQPLGTRRRHLVEQRERYAHRDAVARRAGLEEVLESQAVRSELQRRGEIVRSDAGRPVAQEVVA